VTVCWVFCIDLVFAKDSVVWGERSTIIGDRRWHTLEFGLDNSFWSKRRLKKSSIAGFLVKVYLQMSHKCLSSEYVVYNASVSKVTSKVNHT
jgi:hypothetical protein